MKTHAKQTGKLNGTLSMVVLGILFLTALPLNSVVAASNEQSNKYEATDNHSLIESYTPIETWMITLTEWNTENLVVEADGSMMVEDWMLTPENWDRYFQAELSDAPETNLKQVNDWMFEPAEWRNDFARLGHDFADRDLVMIPFYF